MTHAVISKLAASYLDVDVTASTGFPFWEGYCEVVNSRGLGEEEKKNTRNITTYKRSGRAASR